MKAIASRICDFKAKTGNVQKLKNGSTSRLFLFYFCNLITHNMYVGNRNILYCFYDPDTSWYNTFYVSYKNTEASAVRTTLLMNVIAKCFGLLYF